MLIAQRTSHIRSTGNHLRSSRRLLFHVGIMAVPALLAILVFAASSVLMPPSATAQLHPSKQAQGVSLATGFEPEGCLGWTIQPSPNGSTFDNYLYSVAALSADDAWAVGGYTSSSGFRPLALHYTNGQWNIDPSASVGTSTSSFRAVAAISSDDVWAVGFYRSDTIAYTLIMHYTGGQWNIVPSPNVGTSNNILNGVSAVSSDDIWAVGNYQGDSANQTLILHYTGGQWNIVPSPNIGNPGRNELMAVAAISSDDVWAVGYHVDASTPSDQTLALHYTNGQWQIVPTPNVGTGRNVLKAISAVSSDDVWAVGTAGTQTLILHYTGGQWVVVPSPNPGMPNNYLSGVAAISADDVWAVGYYYGPTFAPTLVLHYTNGEWNIVPSPSEGTTYNDLKAIAAAPSGDLWAVGYYANPSSLEKTEILHYPDPCTDPTPTPTDTAVATSTPEPPTATPAPPTATPTACTPGSFSDVPPENPFYPFVTCLVNRGIISGYSDCTFRPNNDVTRSQIAKMVSNAAGLDDDPGPQIFEDVDSSNSFYLWINRLSNGGHMGGYPCGTVPEEPCNAPDNRPYFRPFANATRAQLSKIVSNAAGYNDIPVGQIFADVAPDNGFYVWIQRLASRGIIGGYPCGGLGEPCDSENRPYFRPYNNVTRGQASKIVANTFFPDCETPSRR